MAIGLNFKTALTKHLGNVVEAEILYQQSETIDKSKDFLNDFFKQLHIFVKNLTVTRRTVRFKGGGSINTDQVSSPLTQAWRDKKALRASEKNQSRLWQGETGELLNTLKNLSHVSGAKLLAAFGGVERELGKGGQSLFRKGVKLTKRNTPYDVNKRSFISWEDAFKVTERKQAQKLAKSFGASSTKNKISGLDGKHAYRAMFDGLAGMKATVTALPNLLKIKRDLLDDVIAQELQKSGALGMKEGAIFHYLKANGTGPKSRKYVNHQLLERAFLQGVTNPAGFQGVSLNRYIN
jgi:hypothetical protein